MLLSIEVLFRGPSSLYQVLGMTEKHEKAERTELIREQSISKLDAVILVARQIDVKRGGLAPHNL